MQQVALVETGEPEVDTWPALAVLSGHLVVWRRLWRSTIFTSVLQPLLFFVAIGYGLGSLVGGGG